MELFLSSWLYLAYAALLGVIIGSFINVFMYRFNTGRSIGGSSHCLSCQTQLQWFELVPLASYVVLRGRCRSCGSYVPPRYFLVEFTTGMAFLTAAAYFMSPLLALWAALILAILICILVYDLQHTIIPDVFTLTLTVLALGVFFTMSHTEPWWFELLSILTAGLAAAGPFLFLWVISRGRWIGLGDAKLAFPLGMLVGLNAVFSLVVLSFWIGAVVSVAILAFQQLSARGKLSLRLLGRPLTMKSEVPFAPFLIASFVLTFFGGVNVLTVLWYAF